MVFSAPYLWRLLSLAFAWSRTAERLMKEKTLSRLLAPHPRVRVLRPGVPHPEGQCVVYWMQRAQRGYDNPALNMAIALGNALGQPVLTVFSLTADYPERSGGITDSWWRVWLMSSRISRFATCR